MTDTTHSPNGSQADADIHAVIDFLNSQPDFLAANPQILARQRFPAPDEESGLVDFQHYMVRRLRTENARLRDMMEEIIDNGRDNISVQSFTLTAALALLNTLTATDFKRLLHQDLPRMLDVDLCLVALENRHPVLDGTPPAPILGSVAPVWLEPSTVNRVLGTENDICLDDSFVDHMGLFGEAGPLIRSAALVRLHAGSVLPSGLFVLGSRSAATFSSNQATELVSFLTRVVENCLYRFFEPLDH